MSENGIKENLIKSRRKRVFFFVSVLVFLLMFLARDFLEYSISPMVFLAYAAVVLTFYDKSEMMAFIVALTAINIGFQYVYAIGLGIVLFIIKYGRDFTINKRYLILFSIILVWEILHFIYKPFSVYKYFQLMMPFILLALIFIFCGRIEFDKRLIIATFSYMTVGVMSIILLATLKDFKFSFEAILNKGFRLGFLIEETEEFVLNNNPNFLGLLCNMAICGFHILFNKAGTKKGVKFLYAAMIGVLIIFGLLTESKAFIAILAFIFALSIIVSARGKPIKMLKSFGLYAAFMLVVILVIYLISPQIINNIILRFSAEDLSTGRVSLFKAYSEVLFANPKILFFGVGLQNSYDKVFRIANRVIFNVSHNAIQDTVILWGIPGLALVVSVFIAMFSEAKKKLGKFNLLNYVAIFALIADIQVARLISSTSILLCWVFTYFCLTYNTNEEKKLNE